MYIYKMNYYLRFCAKLVFINFNGHTVRLSSTTYDSIIVTARFLKLPVFGVQNNGQQSSNIKKKTRNL